MNGTTFEAYEAKFETARRLEAEILPRNKHVLFDALAAAAIGMVVIEFEGSGDSGQMEEPVARAADGAVVALPNDGIELERVDWSIGLHKETASVRDCVEIMAWDLLRTTHGGWADNDGGYGEFTFDVAGHSIRLEYNERYTDTNYHEHKF